VSHPDYKTRTCRTGAPIRSRGAYSYVRVGGEGAREALAAPEGGRLYFAGEATDPGQAGTVAGALQSGQRAARELLQSHPR
jgi:monoamine oxidase